MAEETNKQSQKAFIRRNHQESCNIACMQNKEEIHRSQPRNSICIALVQRFDVIRMYQVCGVYGVRCVLCVILYIQKLLWLCVCDMVIQLYGALHNCHSHI